MHRILSLQKLSQNVVPVPGMNFSTTSSQSYCCAKGQ